MLKEQILHCRQLCLQILAYSLVLQRNGMAPHIVLIFVFLHSVVKINRTSIKI